MCIVLKEATVLQQAPNVFSLCTTRTLPPPPPADPWQATDSVRMPRQLTSTHRAASAHAGHRLAHSGGSGGAGLADGGGGGLYNHLHRACGWGEGVARTVSMTSYASLQEGRDVGVWGCTAPCKLAPGANRGCMKSTLAAALLFSHKVLLLCQAILATPPFQQQQPPQCRAACATPLQPHALATPCSTAAEAAAALPEDRLAGLTVPPEPVLMALATTVALAPYLVTAREAASAKATLQGGVGVCMCQRQGWHMAGLVIQQGFSREEG